MKEKREGDGEGGGRRGERAKKMETFHNRRTHLRKLTGKNRRHVESARPPPPLPPPPQLMKSTRQNSSLPIQSTPIKYSNCRQKLHFSDVWQPREDGGGRGRAGEGRWLHLKSTSNSISSRNCRSDFRNSKTAIIRSTTIDCHAKRN